MKKQTNNSDADEHRDAVAADETENSTPSELDSTAPTADSDDERGRLEAQLRRTMADLANIRKRHARELDDARRRAIEGLSGELLPVLDNFHLALGVQDQQGEVSPDVKAMLDGLLMVRSLLEGTLERHGLAEIPALGEPFDPNRHEAVVVDNESGAEAGTITAVMQRGYMLGDKVLRAPRVVVAGTPQDDASNDSEN